MKLQEAFDIAYALVIPEFLLVDGIEAVNAERLKTEEALKTISDVYAQEADPGFDFDVVLQLADRNRILCDELPESSIGRSSSPNIKRALSLDDTLQALARLQNKPLAAIKQAHEESLDNLRLLYNSNPVQGTVVGIDIETTNLSPDRGYIVNVGWEFLDLTKGSLPYDPHSVFCSVPACYKERGIPLQEIHHITYDQVEHELPFRENTKLHQELLEAMMKYPYMAHNASFEDSWFTYHLPGYAQARKEGKITIIDSREICRRVDPEFPRIPREMSPASLESWAKRRKTLGEHEQERHLGLDDVDLMLRTVLAEYTERGLLLN